MSRLSLAPLLLVAACQRGPAPGNAEGPPPPTTANAVRPQSEAAAAEQVVRRSLGNAPGIVFSPPVRRMTDGVPVYCGDFVQGGRRQRYIVVERDQAFIESQMRAGEMDRAVREFCGDGERG